MSILRWLVAELEKHCMFPIEDLECDCKEILNIESIDPQATDETVICEKSKKDLLKRLKQWQRDKEFLGSLDLHVIVARHLRECCRASGKCDFLGAWKDEKVKLDGTALARELESVVVNTLGLKAPSGLDAEAGGRFKTEISLGPLETFHEGLEKMIGYPSLNTDPMRAMKKEHEHDEPFEDLKFRRIDPRKEWNIVIRSGRFKIDEVGCDPDFHIKDRVFMHDLEHYVGLAEADFKEAELNRAEIAALRLWTGPMHSRYAEGIRKTKKDAGDASSVCKGSYVNTLHAINSGITKLARIWKVPRARKVYRGYKNVEMQLLKKDRFGCVGGVETSFLATSESRDMALCYAGDEAFILEINVGQVNKGADISWLSQFPHEKEILFNAMSNVEFLGSPQLCFVPKIGNTKVYGKIKVYDVQINSNVKSRTLDEFVNLRRDLHLNMSEVLLTQANRLTSDRAKTSDHELIEDLCLKCNLHSETIFESGKNTDASVFNDGSPEYLRLVKEVITFQESSLTLLESALEWFESGSACWDRIMRMQGWQLDALRAAFKGNKRPRVLHLILAEGEKAMEHDIFDAHDIDLKNIATTSAMLAIGRLLSLNPRLQALRVSAEWATADVWENLFQEFQSREGGFTINGFELAQYSIPNLQSLVIQHAQCEDAKMIIPALRCHPPPSLTSLSLRNCLIGCAGAESLGRSFTCLRSLMYLSLVRCGVGSRGCATLARNVTVLNQLKAMILSHNIIENEAALLLASTSSSLVRLKLVDLRFNVAQLRPSLLGTSCRLRTNILVDVYFGCPVNCVAWSPEGSKIAAGTYDGAIIICDAKSRKKIRWLKLHDSEVQSVAWSREGSKIASASSDQTIIIWDAVTGEQKTQLRGHTDVVWSVAWSPEGSKIASGSTDKTVIIWDAETGEQKTQLKGHTHGVQSVAWSPEGSKIASGSFDATVIIWDAETGEQKTQLNGHSGTVYSVAWSPEGSKIVSAGGDIYGSNPEIIVWDAASGNKLSELKGHINAVNSVAWSPEGSKIASGSWDNTVIIWDAETGEQKTQLKGHTNWVQSVAWSPEGSKIASGSCDSTIIIWDAETKKQKMHLKGHTLAVQSVVWSPQGFQIASGSADKTIIIWDAVTGEQNSLFKGHIYSVRSVAWSSEGQIASGSEDNTIFIWDTSSGQLEQIHMKRRAKEGEDALVASAGLPRCVKHKAKEGR